ncbi:MAG: adenosylcobinamide-GDP ribazoletransferase [Ketobacteraceae bacterium]|nr:adenosylcobinamide-GDP ribazoletransferase [Ketobacteraceae bacterium]
MNGLWFAIQFLTRLPLPVAYRADNETQRQSLYWHGTVGLLIGLVLALVSWLGHWLFREPLLIAALVLLTWVLITGALHLDGLGDSADAWLGGYGDQHKTLAIMKDPTSGPAAIVCITLLLLVKVAAITALLKQQSTWALLFVPAMARFAGMCLLASTRYVRKQGLGAPLADSIDTTHLVIQGFALTIAALVFFRVEALVSILLCIAVWFLLRQLMLTRIGGTTGDTAGALIEIIEAVALLGFCVSLGQ